MAFIEPIGWWGPMHRWLMLKANAHYHEWLLTPKGKGWHLAVSEGLKNESPYRYGYTQPQWMHDLIAALGRNDEETCKRIKLENL